MLRFPRLGLWWDLSPRDTLREPAYTVAAIVEHGITDVCVEVHGQTDGDTFAWTKWTPDELVTFADLLQRHTDARLTLMVWPRPTGAGVESIVAAVPPVAELCRAVAIEFDVEGGNWKDGHVRDYISLSAAGSDLVAEFRKRWAHLLGATFHMGRINRTVSAHVDYVAPQAYSVATKDDRGWGDKYGPGNMQREAWARTRDLDAKFTVLGLAAYGQTGYGDPAKAMTEALAAGRELGAAAFRWWSAKHVVGPKANAYASRWLRLVADEVRGGAE